MTVLPPVEDTAPSERTGAEASSDSRIGAEASHLDGLRRIASTSLQAGQVASPGREIPDVPPLPRRIQEAVFADSEIQEYVRSPRLNCYNAARRAMFLVKDMGVAPQAVAMLMWVGLSDNCPSNHFAVRFRHEDVEWVVDPTAAQFDGVKPGIRAFDAWRDELVGTMPGTAVSCQVFSSMSEAFRFCGPYVRCCAHERAEHVVNKPNWYKRIEKNPAAAEELIAKFIARSTATAIEDRRLPRRARALAALRHLVPCLPKR